MKDDKIQTLLILKYGSMEAAFSAWMTNPVRTFNADENAALVAYSEATYPNLKLIRSNPEKG